MSKYRIDERAEQRKDFTQNLIEAVRVCARPLKSADEYVAEYDDKYARRMGENITREKLLAAAAWLSALAKEWK